MRLIFYYPHNRLFRHDGDEFQARALDLSKLWTMNGQKVRTFAIPKDNNERKSLYVQTVLATVCNHSIDRIAFFCHGTSNWFDAGFVTSNIATIKDELRRVLIPNKSKIALFCCATGSSDNGLAMALSAAADAPVMAHKTSGHTTRNPYKRMFENGLHRDMWPKDRKAFREWQARLATPFGPFEAWEEM